MSDPFILVTTHAVAPEHSDDVAELAGRYEQSVRAAEPGLLAFHASVSEDGGTLTLTHVLEDAAAAEAHLGVAAPFIARTKSMLRNVRIDAYGVPGPELQAALDRNASNGAAVNVQPHTVGSLRRELCR